MQKSTKKILRKVRVQDGEKGIFYSCINFTLYKGRVHDVEKYIFRCGELILWFASELFDVSSVKNQGEKHFPKYKFKMFKNISVLRVTRNSIY